ncbi:subtilisin-like protein, partial [Aureobasidium melanogenum]
MTTYVDSNKVQYLIRCNADNSFDSFNSTSVSSGGFGKCFPACDNLAACAGFTFVGSDSGVCYLKSNLPVNGYSSTAGSNYVTVALLNRDDQVDPPADALPTDYSGPSPGSKGTPIGAIVGGAIGGLVLVLLALLVFICLRRRRRIKNEEIKSATQKFPASSMESRPKSDSLFAALGGFYGGHTTALKQAPLDESQLAREDSANEFAAAKFERPANIPAASKSTGPAEVEGKPIYPSANVGPAPVEMDASSPVMAPKTPMSLQVDESPVLGRYTDHGQSNLADEKRGIASFVHDHVSTNWLSRCRFQLSLSSALDSIRGTFCLLGPSTMQLSLLSLSVLVASVLASPTGNYVIHEKRDTAPMGWNKGERLDRRALLPMKIALTQRNLDQAAEYLYEVSHPESPKYGQHWTAQEVADHFAPSDETISSVMDWLIASGISSDSIKLSKGKNWINLEASADQAESLLNTKYHVYEHGVTGQPHIGCDEYSLPKHLKDHIDFVTPSLHFDTRVTERKKVEKRDVTPNTGKQIGQPSSGSTPVLGQWINKSQFITQLEQCDEQITPNCLKALYQIPKSTGKSVKNSYGIVEYTPQAYVPSDLDLFFANFSTKQVGDRPITDFIDGGVIQATNRSFSFNGESDLDLEYAMTLIYPEKVTLYQVGDLVEGASFNNFLDAIDASYCTYEGGDDPSQDAVFPDPAAGGYKGNENCGTFAPTKVISTSYGYNEADLTPFYEKRQCDEYMKLGLMGTSVLYSSGDYGVAGNGGQCIAANGTYNSGKDGRFNPSFPGTCPYVTSVGATQVIPGTNIIEALATGTQPEEACETVIYSGGGFSNVFDMPSYQASAVKSWFKNYPPPYGADRFNNTQKTRGYPDVSANGANYIIAIDGAFGLVYGTSASSPTFGSILTIINERRLQLGKSSIGFINPTLYAHPEVLNDITQGGNQGCGTPGFSASKGWDPVTGLGTPNSIKMMALFLSLP